MSDTPAEELIGVLRNLREHARFAGELGVEHLSIDSPDDISATLATAAASSIQPTLSTKAISVPSRPAAPDVIQPSESLFEDFAPAQTALSKSSETLEQIWADIGDCTRCGLC